VTSTNAEATTRTPHRRALVEAEDWRQLRLHALEVLAERLTARGNYGDAAAAALAAVRAEPLRESPRAALIRVHIAEGNPTEALQEFARYGELLMLELGVEPTERLRALVADLWAVTRRACSSKRPVPGGIAAGGERPQPGGTQEDSICLPHKRASGGIYVRRGR
jgi:hypothetical protein